MLLLRVCVLGGGGGVSYIYYVLDFFPPLL